MDPTITAALIGAIATVAAAVIGHQAGKKRGLAKGREHSLLKFMDEQEIQLNHAMDAVNRRDYRELEAVATAIVDTATTWRRIQENFQALLNGRINDIAGILRQGRPENLENSIRALHEGFRARRLAVETELERSTV